MNGIIDALMKRQSKPKVINGQLERPYPIESKGDMSRARVLPMPMQQADDPMVDPLLRDSSAIAPESPDQGIAMELFKRLMMREQAGPEKVMPITPVPSEQPQSGFDYVMKRNQMMNGMGR